MRTTVVLRTAGFRRAASLAGMPLAVISHLLHELIGRGRRGRRRRPGEPPRGAGQVRLPRLVEPEGELLERLSPVLAVDPVARPLDELQGALERRQPRL